MVYPGRPGGGESALREGSLVGLLSGLRDCPGAWPKATGQARWGTGVWMSAVPGAGVGRGPVMKVAAIAAAQANAAGVGADAHGKHGRNRAYQAARHY
jgi:hypothetical protein